MKRNHRFQLGLGDGIELIEKDDGCGGVIATFTFAPKLVADLAAAENHALSARNFPVLHYGLEAARAQLDDRAGGVGMTQHALGSKDDQRLAPAAQRLTPQHMKILGGGGRLTDLDVLFGGGLEITLDASAGVFRTLAFVSVRQQQDETGEQAPLVFPGDEELVDDDLRAVGEVAELRLPQHQSVGIVAAESVFKTEHGSLGKKGVPGFEPRLAGLNDRQRNVFALLLDIDLDVVAMVE